MNDIEPKERITARFAWALVGYGVALLSLQHWLAPASVDESRFALALEGMSPGMSGLVGLLALGFAVALALAGAGLVRTFWNRFMSDVFRLRQISFPEALSLVLIWSLFFGHLA